MQALLGLSSTIDGIVDRVGRSAIWLILVAVLISAGNAIIRKVFNMSSNAFLEIQWYLFSGIFMLGAAYTLQHNEHVRIDVLSSRFSRRTRAWMEVFGTVVFLLPICVMMVYLGVPWFIQSFNSGEMSANAGGLIQWPVKLLLPIGFILLTAQGISELIKELAFLTGAIPDPQEKHEFPSAEENLIEEIKKMRAENAND